jgi:hypothetical protein
MNMPRDCVALSKVTPRRFPPPWSIEEKLSFSARWH